MLAFFRKYQKIFFLFTTVIIVVSFAFFGSYQAFLPSRGGGKEVAFKSLDGKKVSQGELSQLCHFFVVGGQGGIGNIFNDGVIEKDFLESGLATRLALKFQKVFAEDFSARFRREKSYAPYVHEKSATLSARTLWAEYAPQINQHLASLQGAQDPFSPEVLNAKCALYLAQSTFPPFLLQRALGMALREKGLQPDSRLQRGDLSLFGYKHLPDWFGHRFISSMAQVVINGAALAKEKGYFVTDDEVVADLFYRANQAYRQMKGQFGQRVKDPGDYYKKCLNAIGMQEAELVNVWKKVLLFRRLLDDVGGAAIVDTFPMRQFYGYANESAKVSITRVPEPYRFSSYEEMQKFELYLEGVCEYSLGEVTLPTAYLSGHEVQKRCEELAVKHYDCTVATVKKQDLAAKVSVKQTWEWEVIEENFEKLKSRFFELALEKVSIPEERFALLQKLPPQKRAEVDTYARELIVEAHPNWLQEALSAASPQEKRVTIGTNPPLVGINDPKAFAALLDEDPKEQLLCYTQDGKIYHCVSVNEISDWERLSFEEALESGVLDELLHQKLHAHFLALREKVSGWKKASGEYKSLHEVRAEVADALFAPLLQKLYRELVASERLEKGIALEQLGQALAPYRFAFFVSEHKEQTEPSSMGWALQREELSITRASPNVLTFEEALALQETPSEVRVNEKQGPYFVTLVDHKKDKTIAIDKLTQMQALLRREAKNHLFERLLSQMEEKSAFWVQGR